MRKLIGLWFCLSVALIAAVNAQSSQVRTIILKPIVGSATAVSCAESNAFIARTSGAPNTSAYAAAICGLVSDGVWAKLDVLYFMATDSSGNALLNLTSSSFALTATGGPTFTANTGYSNAALTNLTSTYNPSTAGGNWQLASASIFAWGNTTAADTHPIAGLNIATVGVTYIYPNNAGTILAAVDDAASSYSCTVSAGGDGKGLVVSSRTGATTMAGYKNGNVTPFCSVSTLASSILNGALVFLKGDGNQFYTGQVSAGGAGGGLTATDTVNLYNRVHTYLNTVNAAAFP